MRTCDPAHRQGRSSSARSAEGQRKTGPSPRLLRRSCQPRRRHYHARTGLGFVRRKRCPRASRCDRAVSAQAWIHIQKKSLVAAERLRAKVRKQPEDWFKHRVPAVSARRIKAAKFMEPQIAFILKQGEQGTGKDVILRRKRLLNRSIALQIIALL